MVRLRLLVVTSVLALAVLAAPLLAQAPQPGAKPTVSKSGYMFLDFWFLAGYDYNPNDPFDPSPKQVKGTIPANILALEGKKVEIYGNILPLDYDSSGTSSFILNASVDACGFGGVPRINEWVFASGRAIPSCSLPASFRATRKISAG